MAKKPKPKEHKLQAGKFDLGGLDFAKPALTAMWSETNVPEFIALEMQAMHHFSKLGLLDKATGRYPKRDDVVAYYKQQRLSDGTFISPRRARELAPNLRPVAARKGGNQKVVPKG